MPILLAVLATFTIGAGEFLAAGATERARSQEVTSMMFVGGVLLTGVVAIFWPGDPSSRDLAFGALAGATNGTAILLLYLAYSRGSLRSAAPAAAVVMSSVPVLWDVVVSGTEPTVVTWAGIVLGLAAIGLTSYEGGEADDDSFGLKVAVLAGAVFGALFILLGEISDGAGGTPLLLQRIVGLTVAVTFTRLTGPRMFPAGRAERIQSIVVGLFATTSVILIVVALQLGGSLSVVGVISSQYAAVAVLLGVTLRNQRMRWWQAVGLAAASLAVALITLG